MHELKSVGNKQRAIYSISPLLKDQEKLKLTQILNRGVCIKTERAVAENLFIPQAPTPPVTLSRKIMGNSNDKEKKMGNFRVTPVWQRDFRCRNFPEEKL